jgi:lysophospholipase L1-like esterase
VPRPLVRSALLLLVLIATAAGGFSLGRSQCTATFDAYRDVRGRVLAMQSAQPADGAVLLLGSSTLERLNGARLGVSTTNLARGGDTIVDLLERLPPHEVLARSAAVVVLVGFNDLKHGTAVRQALERYDQLLLALAPAPLTLCLTLQPLSADAASGNATLAADIVTFNEGVRERCSDGPRLALVDLERALLAGAETSPESLYVDEIHLSSVGYEVLATTLRAVLGRMPGPGA